MLEPQPNLPSDKAGRETVRIVLRLDDAITAYRAGQESGVRALDLDRHLLEDLAAEGLSGEAVRDVESAMARLMAMRRVPRRPDRVELAILTALADTYGSEVLTNASLGYALRLVARHGGVAIVQRVLWGESASDAQLAVMLTATRAAFTQISLAFTDAFLVDAHAVLAAYRGPPRAPPPGASAPKKSDHD
ncbi:hypothetical protein [Caballeronia sp. M23-90]